MVNYCANPRCSKPLHYLRDGRVYLFTSRMPDSGDQSGPHPLRLQHYWLCGSCSQSMTLVQDAQAVRILPRRPLSTLEDSKEAIPEKAPFH